jgi:hypothetical protein
MYSVWPVVYIAAVAVVGFGTGLWLHLRLQNENQLTFKLRSPFAAIPTHIEWTAQESHSHA